MTPKNLRQVKATVDPLQAEQQRLDHNQSLLVRLAQHTSERVDTLDTRVDRLEGMTLAQRLRWLATGRLPETPAPLLVPVSRPSQPH